MARAASARRARPVLPFDYANSGDPAVSPDARWIAFTSGLDGDYEIYVARINGSGRRQLTHNHGYGWQPQWLPDSRRIVFVGRGPDPLPERRELVPCIVSRDGAGLRKLAPEGTRDDRALPSPDGRWVAYVTFWPNDEAALTVTPTSPGTLQRVAEYDGYPQCPHLIAWSPDSRWIVYDLAHEEPSTGPRHRLVVRIDGKEGPYLLKTFQSPPPVLTIDATGRRWPR